MLELWEDKYRPSTFSEVIGVPEVIVKTVETGSIPHSLFIGTPGTGKTSTSKIILEELDCKSIFINGSNERGIDTVRDKIQPFMEMSSKKIKIIQIEEFQRMTIDAQRMLLNVMDENQGNARLLCTANDISKMDDALLNRFKVYEFVKPKKSEVFDRVLDITVKENVIISKECINLIVDKHYPSIRKCISYLHELVLIGKPITEEYIQTDKTVVMEVFSRLKNADKFNVIRQFILDENISHQKVMIEMYMYLIGNQSEFKEYGVVKIMKPLIECNRYINNCLDSSIEFDNLIFTLCGVFKK